MRRFCIALCLWQRHGLCESLCKRELNGECIRIWERQRKRLAVRYAECLAYVERHPLGYPLPVALPPPQCQSVCVTATHQERLGHALLLLLLLCGLAAGGVWEWHQCQQRLR